MKNPAIFDQNKLSFGIKGLFFPETDGEIDPAVAAPVIPLLDSKSASKIQVFASDYMLDSFSSSFFKTNDISQYGIWVNHTIIPEGHPLRMNSDALGLFFPSVLASFGRNKPVDVHFELRGLKNI